MKKIVVIFLCLIALTGCSRKLENRGTKVIKKETKEEVVEKTEEMIYFDELLNSKENIGFLLSTYSTFDKIDFEKLLIEFPVGYSDLLDHNKAEYKNLIINYPELTDKEIYKMTSNQLKKYIKNKTGYALEEYEKNNLSNMIYMEVYDTYYTISKFDENLIDVYKVVQDENIYNIYYNYNKNKYKVVLKKVDNKYTFTSNIVNN